MRAKLVREIPQRDGSPWYFRKYELECIDCGEHYTNGRYDNRTSPYCGECRRKHDTQKAKKLKAKKEQALANNALKILREEIIERRDNMADMAMNYGKMSGLNMAIDIIDKHLQKSQEGESE